MMVKAPIVALAVVILAAVQLPVSVAHERTTPKEASQYIRRVFAAHTVGQAVHTTYVLNALDVMVRSDAPGRKEVTVTDEQRIERARVSLDVAATDTWRRLALHTALPPGAHTLTMSAPSLSTQAEAVLLRYQPDSLAYPDGQMVVDGQPSYGDLAFRTIERAPLWRAFLVWGQVTDRTIQRGWRILGLGLAVGALLMVAGSQPMGRSGRIPVLAMIVLASFAVAVRAPYTTEIQGVFGGDAFNYLSKARTLLSGRDPFAADPRKAPLFSFLLVPAFLLPDPLTWSRWVGIAAGAAAAATVPFIARRLGLPMVSAVGSGVLAAANQEFIWESASGLANTLLSAMLLACLYAYLRAGEPRWQWILAILLGLTTLARYEGALAAVILLPAAWWQYRLPLTRLAALTALTAALMAVPVSSYLWSGQLGVRTIADIQQDPGLLLATSRGAVLRNLGELKEFVWQAWTSIETPDHIIVALLTGLGMYGAVALLPRPWVVVARRGLPTMLFLALVALVFTKSSAAREFLVGMPLAVAVVGGLHLVRRQRRPTIILGLVAVALAAVITVILPKSRYYLPLVPFFSLAIVAGLAAIGTPARTRPRTALLAATLGVLTSFYLSDGRHTLIRRAEWYNGKAHDTAVMVDAMRYLRSLPDKVGFRPLEEPPTMVYLPPERRLMFRSRADDVVSEEVVWIAASDVTYLVERNREPYWESVRRYPAVFPRERIFASIHGDSQVLVYRVDRLALARQTHSAPLD